MACNSVIGISKSYSIEHLMGTYLTLHVYIIGARADTVHNMPSSGVVRWVHQTVALVLCQLLRYHARKLAHAPIGIIGMSTHTCPDTLGYP